MRVWAFFFFWTENQRAVSLLWQLTEFSTRCPWCALSWNLPELVGHWCLRAQSDAPRGKLLLKGTGAGTMEPLIKENNPGGFPIMPSSRRKQRSSAKEMSAFAQKWKGQPAPTFQLWYTHNIPTPIFIADYSFPRPSGSWQRDCEVIGWCENGTTCDLQTCHCSTAMENKATTQRHPFCILISQL